MFFVRCWRVRWTLPARESGRRTTCPPSFSTTSPTTTSPTFGPSDAFCTRWPPSPMLLTPPGETTSVPAVSLATKHIAGSLEQKRRVKRRCLSCLHTPCPKHSGTIARFLFFFRKGFSVFVLKMLMLVGIGQNNYVWSMEGGWAMVALQGDGGDTPRFFFCLTSPPLPSMLILPFDTPMRIPSRFLENIQSPRPRQPRSEGEVPVDTRQVQPKPSRLDQPNAVYVPSSTTRPRPGQSPFFFVLFCQERDCGGNIVHRTKYGYLMFSDNRGMYHIYFFGGGSVLGTDYYICPPPSVNASGRKVHRFQAETC